jgi:hypothetical protein
MKSHSFGRSNLGSAVPSTEILKWITDFYTSINSHIHISKREFVASFFDVNMSDFDFYILKKYLFIPLLVLCIPILYGPTLQFGGVGLFSVHSTCYLFYGSQPCYRDGVPGLHDGGCKAVDRGDKRTRRYR